MVTQTEHIVGGAWDFFIELAGTGTPMDEDENAVSHMLNNAVDANPNLTPAERQAIYNDNNQAIHILRQNYAISINLDITIDKNLKNILTKLKVFDYEYTGGLYTCFNCEEGQLNDNQIKEIVKIAKEDLQNNLINTDKETQYYFICSKCESEVQK